MASFVIITPSDFIQTPHSSSRELTARQRFLWSKRWRRKDSRHSPCTSEVSCPSSPARFAWERLGRLLFVMMLQHPLKTRRIWHLRGPHGQCRQPYHSCCQRHPVTSVPPAITQVRASLASGVVEWSGLYNLALALLAKMVNEMANLTFQKLANEAERKYPKIALASFLLFRQVQISKKLPNWQEICQKNVVRNDRQAPTRARLRRAFWKN